MYAGIYNQTVICRRFDFTAAKNATPELTGIKSRCVYEQ